MKQLIAVATLSLIVVFSGLAQSKEKKGPNYKNAKISEKYDGNSSILTNTDPNQFQGPEKKNFKPGNYQIEISSTPEELKRPNIDLVVSTENKNYTLDDGKEKIIYKRVQTKDMKGKNTQGLKGPAYKNHKP